MKNRILYVAFLGTLAFAAPAGAQDRMEQVPPAAPGHVRQLTQETLTIYNPEGEHHEFTIEIATKPDDQERGLMFRESVPPGTGMLFLFNNEMERTFWMKNTLVPLDMIFIGSDNSIRHIHANALPNDLTPISSEGPAMAVLELPGGTAETLGIKSGDRVSDARNFQPIDTHQSRKLR